MWTAGKVIWTILFLLLLISPAVHCNKKKKKNKKKSKPPSIVIDHYMTNHCGRTFNMTERKVNDAMFGLTSNGLYGSNMTCQMDIVTSSDHRLAIKIQEINLYNCNDWVMLYGDRANASDALTPRICSKATDQYLTPNSRGIITFSSNSIGHRGKFLILITSFLPAKDHKCPSGYFGCGNNRCIRSSLTCNSRDNCGNNRDENKDSTCKKPMEYWFLIGVGVGVVIVAYAIFKHIQAKRIQQKRIAAQKTAPAEKKQGAKKKKATAPKKEPDAKPQAQTNTPASNQNDANITTPQTTETNPQNKHQTTDTKQQSDVQTNTEAKKQDDQQKAGETRGTQTDTPQAADQTPIFYLAVPESQYQIPLQMVAPPAYTPHLVPVQPAAYLPQQYTVNAPSPPPEYTTVVMVEPQSSFPGVTDLEDDSVKSPENTDSKA